MYPLQQTISDIANANLTAKAGKAEIEALRTDIEAIADETTTLQLEAVMATKNKGAFMNACAFLSTCVGDNEAETTSETVVPAGKQVGYVRVSTVDQKTDRQLAGVKVDKLFSEKVSAKTIDRPQLAACLDYLREGDTLHIHSLDRVCRSGAGDAVELVEKLTGQGVGVHFHKEGMHFYGAMTAAQKGVLGILASVAQMERELIAERRTEGMAAARAKGVHMGRPANTVTKEEIEGVMKTEGLSVTKAAEKLGIGRATAYRVMKG